MAISLQTASSVRVTVRGTAYLPAPAIVAAGTAAAAASAAEAEADRILAQTAAAAAAASAAALTFPITGDKGGTGLTTYTTGDLLYASGTTTLAKLNGVATGNVLLSGGIGGAPTWGKVDLTTAVTGALPVANGGSGRASHTAYAVLCGGTTSTGAQQSIASVGTSGHVLTSNGAGALPTFQASSSGLPQGYIVGLALSNNVTDATNDIDIAVGRARNSTNSDDMVLASAITKRLDAAWAVGTGNGGLDTGSIANAWYNMHLIKRVDTGVVDVLFSLSATAPTLPTNYTVFRRIGSILRTGAAIKAFSQVGNQFIWKSPVQDAAGAGPSAGAYYTISVPTGVQVSAIISALFIGSALSYQKVRSPDQTATAASSSDCDTASTAGATTSSVQAERRTDTSARLWAAASSGATTMELYTLGWNDPL